MNRDKQLTSRMFVFFAGNSVSNSRIVVYNINLTSPLYNHVRGLCMFRVLGLVLF